MSVQDITKESVCIRKALRAGTFSHTHNTSLLWMKNTPLRQRRGTGWTPKPISSLLILIGVVTYLFAHRLWVGYSCWEETIPLQTTIQSSPIIMTIASMWKTPWNKSVILPIHGITGNTLCTWTYSSEGSCWRLPILFVLVSVQPEEKSLITSQFYIKYASQAAVKSLLTLTVYLSSCHQLVSQLC